MRVVRLIVVRVVGAGACAVIAAVLLLMLWVGTRVPLDDRMGVGDVMRVVHAGSTGYLDLWLFDEEAGARRLVDVDPRLSEESGREGARWLAKQSRQFDERLSYSEKLLAVHAAEPQLLADVLLDGLNGEPDARRIQTVAAALAALPPAAISPLLEPLATAVIDNGDAALAASAADQIAASAREPGRSAALAQLLNFLLGSHDPDVLRHAGQLGTTLDATYRAGIANRFVSADVVAVLGEETATQLGAAVERTEGVEHLERRVQARAALRAGLWPDLVGLTLREVYDLLAPYGYMLDPGVDDPAEWDDTITSQWPPAGAPRGSGTLAVES